MHSSRAAWVFGEARLISSTRSRFVKIGPGRNVNSFSRWSKTLTPVTSLGSRSGVNWMRENEQSTERASAFASIVFPTPGKSSMIRCPSATRHSTANRSVSSGACTTRATLAVIRAIASPATAGSGAPSTAGLSMLPGTQALCLVEDRGGDLRLGRLRDRPLAVPRHEHDLVVRSVEADVLAADVVVDDQVEPFRVELLACARETAFTGLRREADDDAAVRGAIGERPQDVGRRLEDDVPRRRILGALLGAGLGGPVVGDGGRHQHEIGVGAGERLAL